jgi:hypothetical protein
MCIYKLRVYLLVYGRLRVRVIGRVHGPTRDLSLRYTVGVYFPAHEAMPAAIDAIFSEREIEREVTMICRQT